MITSVIPTLLFSSLVAAYSFTFTSVPTQCKELSLAIQGQGSPPYEVLIIPVGPSTAPNNVEVRRVVDQTFPNNGTTVSFPLNFPTNSQFVAVVSDQSGFGSGGTSAYVTVQSSSNSSCYNTSQSVQPQFVFSLAPAMALTQCSPVRLWWDNSTVQGIPTFQGLIPGGQSFLIPQGSITSVVSEGTGFSWTPSVRAGSTVIVVASDNNGLGDGGSASFIVGYGDNSCLNDNSPSSTPGSPAGGSYPTSTSGFNQGSSSRTNVGGIVGGVVGGVAGLLIIAILLFFWLKRRRAQRGNKDRPSLFIDHDDEDPTSQPLHEDLPVHFRPEPFTASEPTDRAGTPRSSTPFERSERPVSQSLTYLSDPQRVASPDVTSTGLSRKSPLPPSLRPVNVFQHEDAGPSLPADNQEPETIELPPAYTNIRGTPATESPPPTEN
ncbi:hypothetical protein BJ322DRAFT_1048293 [Thelephora terrestris]|uniref:Uncharacterized protein n=1 Tax=Thelephora terrestris TaxID=56493 RepID=A0A9P6L9C0_9AGAM|nr:hypothetical protein BJ322DRAFT_1048293 [Thelephora terrestris]